MESCLQALLTTGDLVPFEGCRRRHHLRGPLTSRVWGKLLHAPRTIPDRCRLGGIVISDWPRRRCLAEGVLVCGDGEDPPSLFPTRLPRSRVAWQDKGVPRWGCSDESATILVNPVGVPGWIALTKFEHTWTMVEQTD